MLNPEQQAVVDHLDGPMRVGAVAGSGKTTALIERVVKLVQKHGVPARKVLVISFSKAACEEVKKRLSKKMPGVDVDKSARTFHSLGLEIYRAECADRGTFIDNTGILWLKTMTRAYRDIGMKNEKKALKTLSSYIKNHMLDTTPVMRRPGKVDPRVMEAARSICDQVASHHHPTDVVDAYYRAEEIRSKLGIAHRGETHTFVTFDDMIYQSAMALRHQDVRERWSRRWDYILQDESQDENTAQAAIAESLAREHRNYMVVGDPAQCIYQWRGANPKKILAFEQEWHDASTIMMHRNYRSGIEIVDLANRIISQMPASTVITDDLGFAPDMTSERQTHAYVDYHRFTDSRREADGVADNIVAHHEQGIEWRGQAILVRQNRMTLDIELALADREVPYKMLTTGASFFDMKETKLVLGYMRMIFGRGDKDDFGQSLLFPTRGVSRAFANKVIETQEERECSWRDALREHLAGAPRGTVQWLELIDDLRRAYRSMTAGHAVEHLMQTLKLDDWFSAEGDAEADGASSDSNLAAMRDLADRFETPTEMLDAIDRMVAHRRANIRKRDVVIISTVHRAKGREWPIVYIPQLGTSLFPTSKGDPAEERRVFYVACTRAMDELWVSGPMFNGDDEPIGESSLVIEAKLESSKQYAVGRQVKDPEPVGTQMGLGL